MRRKMVRIGLLVLTIAACVAAPSPEQAFSQHSCDAFPAALRNCQPATCTHPHPFVRGFDVQHRIDGTGEAVCNYAQTMPGGMGMSCSLSEAGREEMAGEIEEMMLGNLSGSTSAPETAITRECVVKDSAGVVIPWSTSSR